MKIEDFKKNLPSGLLFAYMVKIIAFGASIPDFGIAGALIAVLGLQFYIEQNKKFKDFEHSTAETLKDMVHTINQQNDVIKKMAVEVDTLRNNVSTLKLVPNMKKML